MSRDPQRLLDYLDHILQAIERIQRYTRAMDEMAFTHSEIVQDAVSRAYSTRDRSTHLMPWHRQP